jgi:hypothetical protein
VFGWFLGFDFIGHVIVLSLGKLFAFQGYLQRVTGIFGCGDLILLIT